MRKNRKSKEDTEMVSSDFNAGDATSEDANFGGTATGEAVENVRQQAGEVAGQVQEKAGQALGQVQEKASEVTARAGEQAKTRLAQGKDQASEQIENVAHALRQAGENLQKQNSAAIGDYAIRASEGLDQLSNSLRESDINDLLRQGEDFARRQPALFLGGAFTVGVLLARFLKSSSQPSYTRRSTYTASSTPVYDSVEDTTRALPAPDDNLGGTSVVGLDDTLDDALDDSLAGDSVNSPMGTAFAPGTPTSATADTYAAGDAVDFSDAPDDLGSTGTSTATIDEWGATAGTTGDDDFSTTGTTATTDGDTTTDTATTGTTDDDSTDDRPKTMKADSVEEF